MFEAFLKAYLDPTISPVTVLIVAEVVVLAIAGAVAYAAVKCFNRILKQ